MDDGTDRGGEGRVGDHARPGDVDNVARLDTGDEPDQVTGDEPGDGIREEPRLSATRTDRRRFLKGAGGLLAGLLAIVTFGFFARERSAPRGTVASGGQDGNEVVSAFPLRSVENAPRIPPGKWVVTVDGLVDNPLRLDRTSWLALAHTEETVDFHCVEGWSVDDVRWRGVRLATLIEMARPRPEAQAVTAHAHGGTYKDSITLAQATDPQTLLADEIQGVALPAENGGPVRLVVPSQLGYKSVKWVERLEFVTERGTGYWEERGYPVDAPLSDAYTR
jgi:DMSO/TMAO reductase YedYZ molybdopterin-dependent catalytic subunit